MSILDSLNPIQREAAKTTEGPLLLLAGAGSGKTRVLTHRIAFLVEKGVSPFNILAITFTNKAAREMKARIEGMVTGGGDIWVSTFHSMCVRILRREIDKLDYDRRFTIYDSADSEKLMKQLIKEHNINDKQFPPSSVLHTISAQKNELVSPSAYSAMTGGDYRSKRVAVLYDAYQKRLRKNNALDFDDIIFRTVELFTKFPDVLDRYQNRFIYIHVDEYQDTNTAQYKLVRLLAEKNENICVVGDDDQSIYGWRGANIRNILDFEKDFPNAKVIRLEQNYRSTGTILDAANGVIKHNKNRKGKQLWTDNPYGAPIDLFEARSDTDEAAFTISTIKERIAAGERYKDFAVLYRANSQSRLFEDRLVYSGVPYRIFGGVRFYERREVKDVLAYLKTIFNPFDDVSLRRVLNVPRRGIGDDTEAKISAYADEMDVPFYDALRKADDILPSKSRAARVREFGELLGSLIEMSKTSKVSELIQELLDRTGYTNELLLEKDHEEGENRVANVMELIAKAQEFESQFPAQSETPMLDAFLEEVALVADIDNYAEGQDAVVLMTMHSAKGLEFKHVFIAGFEEGLFPGYRAASSSDENAMEEERRVCYVAITRAMNTLCITHAKERRQYGRVEYNAPSRFLREIPQMLINNIKNKRPAETVPAEKKLAEKEPRFQITAEHVVKKPAAPMPVPSKSGPPDYNVGDTVSHAKYGNGLVTAINPAGADYEVSVEFAGAGKKKFMAHLSRMVKAQV